MKKILMLCLGACTLLACNDVRRKTTDAALKATSGVGEMVGKTGSEFVDGVKSGIDYTFNCTITVAEPLQKAGISTGKFYLQKDTVKQNYSILSAYIIFGQDYNGTLTAKVFDKNKNEYGRATITVTGKKNEAHYYDWHFDTRTNVEARSLIMLEQ